MTIIDYKGKKIIFISDTHGNHSNLDIPKADFLIHCGDACTDGDINQLSNFLIGLKNKKSSINYSYRATMTLFLI
jgi:predicted phosphodiesterase